MASEDGILTIKPPDTESAIRDALDVERRRLQIWSDQQVKAIETLRDRNLKQLDEATGLLSDGFSNRPGRSGSSNRKRSRRRSGRCTSTQAEARRKGIYRFLLEEDRPMSCAEIRHPLNLTQSQTHRALTRMISDGMVLRSGVGSSVKYEVKPGKMNRTEGRARVGVGADLPLGTRMLKVIQGKGEVTPDELARTLRVPFEHVQRSCGELIREDQISMDLRDGRRVYTSLKVA